MHKKGSGNRRSLKNELPVSGLPKERNHRGDLEARNSLPGGYGTESRFWKIGNQPERGKVESPPAKGIKDLFSVLQLWCGYPQLTTRISEGDGEGWVREGERANSWVLAGEKCHKSLHHRHQQCDNCYACLNMAMG